MPGEDAQQRAPNGAPHDNVVHQTSDSQAVSELNQCDTATRQQETRLSLRPHQQQHAATAAEDRTDAHCPPSHQIPSDAAHLPPFAATMNGVHSSASPASTPLDFNGVEGAHRVTRARTAAVALGSLADHLSRQIGHGKGCNPRLADALRSVFPDAVGLSVAFPLGEGLNSLVSWIVHLHRAQPTSVTHLAVSAAGSDQPATSASAAAADASAARAKQAGTSQIGGAAADHPSDVQSPAGPGGSLLLLPAASSAAGLAVQGGKIVGFSLRDAGHLLDVQYAAGDTHADRLLCFPVLQQPAVDVSVGGSASHLAAAGSRAEGANLQKHDTEGAVLRGSDAESPDSASPGGDAARHGRGVEAAGHAPTVVPQSAAVGVLSVALPEGTTLGRGGAARAVYLAQALAHTLQHDTAALRTRAEAAAQAALLELGLPPPHQQQDQVVHHDQALQGEKQQMQQAEETTVALVQESTQSMPLFSAPAATVGSAPPSLGGAAGAAVEFAAGNVGARDSSDVDSSQISQRRVAQLPPFPDIPDVVKPPKCKVGKEEESSAAEWEALSPGGAGSTQTATLRFKSLSLESDFAAHHATLLTRRMDDVTAVVVVLYVAARLLLPTAFSAAPVGSVVLPAAAAAAATYFRWTQSAEYLERREWLAAGQVVVWMLHLARDAPGPFVAAVLLTLALLFPVRLHTFLATGLATAALPLTRASLDGCLKLPSSSPTTSTVSDGLSMISGSGVAVLSVTGGYGSRLCAIAAAIPCFAIAYAVPAVALYVIEKAQRRTFLLRRRPTPTVSPSATAAAVAVSAEVKDKDC